MREGGGGGAFWTQPSGVRPVNATCRIHMPARTPEGSAGWRA